MAVRPFPSGKPVLAQVPSNFDFFLTGGYQGKSSAVWCNPPPPSPYCGQRETVTGVSVPTCLIHGCPLTSQDTGHLHPTGSNLAADPPVSSPITTTLDTLCCRFIQLIIGSLPPPLLSVTDAVSIEYPEQKNPKGSAGKYSPSGCNSESRR